MKLSPKVKLPRVVKSAPAAILAVCASAALLLGATQSAGQTPHNVPRISSSAKDLGRTNPSRPMNLTVVLKLHDQAGLDEVVSNLYDRKSPTFRQWLTDADLAHYAPTAEEFAAVKTELLRQGYKVLSESPNRTSIRVSGTVGITETAFNTELHDFQYGNRRVFAHVKEAALAGYAGSLVGTVAGLDEHQVRPMNRILQKPGPNGTLQPPFRKRLTEVTPGSIATDFTNVSLGLPVTSTYDTFGSNPTLSMSGIYYDPSGLPVDFTPQQLQEYYGLNDLSARGYNGKGETVALLEAYGYDHELDDANAFSTLFNLPALTTQTFQIIYPNWNGPNATLGDLLGWEVEIALDIQVVHSIAPGAKIVEVAVGGQDNEDLIAGIQYIIDHDVAKIISGSWEVDTDIFAGPAELQAYDSVLQLGAARGFAFQFSTGDHGDQGVGTPVGSAQIPSESPYATAVGGTSVVNDPTGSSFFPLGWGTSDSVPVDTVPVTPPFFSLFYGGAGGGISLHEPKPKWQNALPYDHRAVPDIAAVADPFTGVFEVVTDSTGTQFFSGGVGGTSVASPLVSAIWAIANQYGQNQHGGHGGKRSLGQIAPVVAQLAPGQITDVRPPSASLQAMSLTGVYTDAAGNQTNLSTPDFISAGFFQEPIQPDFLATYNQVFPPPFVSVLVVGFGADGFLHVTDGWDDVTGYGEPNGLPFIQGVQ